jgi:hypothetical protein
MTCVIYWTRTLFTCKIEVRRMVMLCKLRLERSVMYVGTARMGQGPQVNQ